MGENFEELLKGWIDCIIDIYCIHFGKNLLYTFWKEFIVV